MPQTLTNGTHIDAPLSNLALRAFADSQNFIAQQLFPVFPVQKERDLYYVIDPNSWLVVPDTLRTRKTAPRRGEWRVDSAGYVAQNYAWGTDHAKEDIANADQALQVRENSTMYVTETLLRGLERRVAQKVTSVSNVGSGVILSGSAKWGDYVNSDPISDVTTAHAFIRQRTGLRANTAVIDADTLEVLRFHPLVRDHAKYTQSGPVPDDLIRTILRVDRMLVGDGVYNQGNESQAGSMANIWGNNVLLAHVRQAQGLRTTTFGLSFRWTPDGFPGPLVVERYDDPDPGKKAEVINAGFYQDEKIIAPQLAYLIASTL